MTDSGSKVKRGITLFFTFLTFSALIYGFYGAYHSPLFQVKVIEVGISDSHDLLKLPLDLSEIEALVSNRVAGKSLFRLGFSDIEKNILSNPWIREVRLFKVFPQTLRLEVGFKRPLAVFQNSNGSLSYIDHEGTVFGDFQLDYLADLPAISGANEIPKEKILEALKLIGAWDESELRPFAQISNIMWTAEAGFHGMVVFPAVSGHLIRTLVDFGQKIDDSIEQNLIYMTEVIRYLSNRNLRAKMIWTKSGKKIVVKTTHDT